MPQNDSGGMPVFRRLTICCAIDAAIHTESSVPMAVSGVQPPISQGMSAAASRASAAGSQRRTAISLKSAFFQRASGTIAIRNSTGAMVATKTALK